MTMPMNELMNLLFASNDNKKQASSVSINDILANNQSHSSINAVKPNVPILNAPPVNVTQSNSNPLGDFKPMDPEVMARLSNNGKPVSNQADEEEIIQCTIKRIFNNCPKPDGWYGLFASVKGEGDIKLSGITELALCKDMKIEVSVTPDPKNNSDMPSYIWRTITVITKTRTGLISYLKALPGVSAEIAKKVASTFDKNVLDEIENNIDNVKKKCKLTDKQADALYKGVTSTNALNRIQKKIPELTKNQISYCVDRLGIPIGQLLDTIEQDPYILCQIPSVSFRTADTIAIRLGKDPKSNYRIACGTKYIMNQNKDNLYVNLSNDSEFFPLYRDTMSLLMITDMTSLEYCDKLQAISADSSCPIIINMYNNEAHLYTKQILGATNTIAYQLTRRRPIVYASSADINSFIRSFEINQSNIHGTNISLNAEQKQAVINAMTNPISIVTGGPGRGKTLTINCIAHAWRNLHPYANSVRLLAPTGKATAKLNDMTNHIFSETCMTVDKLICKLEWQSSTKNKTGIKITPETLIIIDESSMLDILKAAHLLSQCAEANFCFVGDVDQLPPIEIGNYFKDIIASGVIPTTVLKTPMRNGGTILMNAEKINNNDPSLMYNFVDMPLINLPDDSEASRNVIIEQYFDEIQKLPQQDSSQLALLCPMKKGEIGAIKLNMAIQNRVVPLNPAALMAYDKRRGRNVYNTTGFEIPNHLYGNKESYTKFRIGDTVINTENNNAIDVFRYENDDWFNGDPLELDRGITNGDCGKIIQYIPPTYEDHEYIVVQLFDGRFVQLDCNVGDFDKFELGYALTVHKAQGSEYHTVMYVSPLAMRNLTGIGFANKNIVYTAVTRAQKRVVIIGSKDGLDASILCSVKNGNTKLPEMLQ